MDIPYLRSLIPELKYKALTYDISKGWPPPAEGDYLVSIGRKTKKVGTVYQVAAVRLIAEKKPRSFNRWHVTTIVVNDLKDKVVLNRPAIGRPSVYVDGTLAWAIEWYSRGKKRKR